MDGLLESLARRGVLGDIDVELARAAGRLAGEEDPLVLVALALASRAVQHGHVCVDLRRLGDRPLLDREERPVEVPWPDRDDWLMRLRRSPLVSSIGEDTSGPVARRPLVVDAEGRVYLHRYAEYQRRLVESVAVRAGKVLRGRIADEALDRYFAGGDDGQRRAARAALAHRFSVISGGPGTGKTTTVVRVLALLHEQALEERGRVLRVQLLAPTGKATQRLRESIQGQLPKLDCSEAVRAALEENAVGASTIHRALEYQPRTPTRFVHGADRPLAADVVLVDEASMVDLALMCKLVEAVPSEARLILMGDKDQLASVEAGAILGDIYQADLGAAAVHLERSHRFDPSSDLGRLVRAIHGGDPDAVFAALRGRVALAPFAEDDPLGGRLGALVASRLKDWFRTDDPEQRLRWLGQFRILCAHRRGPAGADALNRAVEDWVLRTRLGESDADEAYYDGRPILITRNDRSVELYNGDVGVIGRVRGQPFAFFPERSGAGPRRVSVARLPEHETVFAMTVHKSQGSEFDDVALVLPERPSPVVTRELLYTGVSRARVGVTIFGDGTVLHHALASRIERASGLPDALARACARDPG